MKRKITEAQARRIRVGDQFIVLESHHNQHGKFLRKNLRGVVRSVEEALAAIGAEMRGDVAEAALKEGKDG